MLYNYGTGLQSNIRMVRIASRGQMHPAVGLIRGQRYGGSAGE